ncbi:MAG: LLM class flavin-dependent oxidoreductase, partial [Acidimicrobiia bacterium]
MEPKHPVVGVWLGVRPEQMIDFARRAEAIGCESVWCPEHLIWPAEIRSPYPYSGNGRPPVPHTVRLYDPWVLLAAVASATTTVRLGTCVYVLPLRPALVTARAVAT